MNISPGGSEKTVTESMLRCPACGALARDRIQIHGHWPTVEIETYVRVGRLFLVRAQLDIGPPILIHPFAISEVGVCRGPPPKVWRARQHVCRIFSERPLTTFQEAEAHLKEWATRFVEVGLF